MQIQPYLFFNGRCEEAIDFYRQARDRVNAKVMADPRMAKMMDPSSFPFDGKRLIFGGFKRIVER